MNGFDSVIIKEMKETAPGKWEVRLMLPSGSPYFRGHFHVFHLLPAVATVDIVTILSSKIKGAKVNLTGIAKSKFTSPILPDSETVFIIDLSKAGTIKFSARTPSGRACAQGLLRYDG